MKITLGKWYKRHMKFYRDLYIGDTVKKPQKAIKKLKRYKIQPGLYVIVLEAQPARLAFYHSLVLTQWYYRKNPPACVVGLANGREEAMALIEKIAQDAIAATGGVSLVEYLSQRDAERFSAHRRETATD